MKKWPLILIFISNSIFAQEKLLPPTPDLSYNALNQFLDSLKQAVTEKDKNFIIDHLSGDVMVSFGGNGGITEFKTHWNWDQESSGFWNLMERLLAMGGGQYEGAPKSIYTKRKSVYQIPYVSSEWPDYDPFEYMAVTGDQVPVRSKPDNKADLVGKLSFDIVKYDYDLTESARPVKNDNEIGPRNWYYVTSLDEKISGYVSEKDIWSPIDYRMRMYFAGDKWIITSLLAGD